jgi:hypothetical protein
MPRMDCVTNEPENEDLIIRYFFGELDEEEKNRIEQEFLSDNQFFEQMLSIEEDLIHDFVRGRLAEPGRKKVKEFLESSDRLKSEVKLVERLIGDVARTRSTETREIGMIPAERPSTWRSLLAFLGQQNSGKRFSFALLLLLVVPGFGLAIWNVVLQHKLSQIDAKYTELEMRNQELDHRVALQAENDNKLTQRIEDMDRKSDQIDQEINTIKESRSKTLANDTVTLALAMQAFTKGGGELKVVRIGPGTNWLQIGVDVGEGDFNSYDATIETFEGRLVWSKDDLKPARAKVGKIILTLPARLFANKDYTLTLNGRRNDGSTIDIGEFSFRVKE